jgi:spectinomycin phosphotransferase/16S rRNA (guanine(1405)-N(7))-methyltransferase
VLAPPDDVSDSEVAAAVEQWWRTPATSIDYLAVGFGSHHWRTGELFVTVDVLDDRRHRSADTVDDVFARHSASLAVATHVPFAVAPKPSVDGTAVRRLDHGHSIAVYPFVDGRSHDYGSYVDATHRSAVLDLVVQLHGLPLHDAPVDPLEVLFADNLERALTELDQEWDAGPYGERTRDLLATHREPLAQRLALQRELAARVSRDGWILTHGEPHAANTMLLSDGDWRLIDWDTAAVGPPERDLWMLGEDAFDDYAGSSGRAVDRDVVALYELMWSLTEVSLYTRRFQRPHTGDANDIESWDNLVHYLA